MLGDDLPLHCSDMVCAVTRVVFTVERECKKLLPEALPSPGALAAKAILSHPGSEQAVQDFFPCVLCVRIPSGLKTASLHLQGAPEWRGLLCSFYTDNK